MRLLEARERMDALNRKVAFALGWVEKGVGWWISPKGVGHSWHPSFCTSANGAESVREGFRVRGIGYREEFLPKLPGVREKDMLCVHWNRGFGMACDTHWGPPDTFEALCEAFVAATKGECEL